MEKQTKADNEVETLTTRWDTVKKVADDRVTKVRVGEVEGTVLGWMGRGEEGQGEATMKQTGAIVFTEIKSITKSFS